jgi:NAD(P)-dependent dehydrogenase (short-subunit alcohol dehydrogenase family)
MQKRNRMKNVLITGGGTGIGLAIARAFDKRDDICVTICGRRQETLEAATAQSLSMRSLVMDVTNEKSIQDACNHLKETSHLPNILVNCAGSAYTAPLHKTSLEAWQGMLNVNLTGVFLVTKAFLPYMKQQNVGRIINVASTAGLKGYAYTAAYTAAKHGVIGMTRALALELAGTQITANAVCPGFTDTEIVQRSITNIVEKTGRSEEEALTELTTHHPSKRLVKPEEVADAVIWLASEGASSINGQSIAVDGGETM